MGWRGKTTMNLNDIPDNIGGVEGIGAEFRESLSLFVQLKHPGRTPEQIWRHLWENFDMGYADLSDIELAYKIITWFLSLIETETDYLDP
jgi:hypothetical protein